MTVSVSYLLSALWLWLMDGKKWQVSDGNLGTVPQRTLIQLLKEIRPEEKWEDPKVDPTQHGSFLLVSEGGVLGAMADEEAGSFVAEAVWTCCRWAACWRGRNVMAGAGIVWYAHDVAISMFSWCRDPRCWTAGDRAVIKDPGRW